MRKTILTRLVTHWTHRIERAVSDIAVRESALSAKIQHKKCCFQCVRAPALRLGPYLLRVCEYLELGPSTIVVACIYFTRFLATQKDMVCDLFTKHRIAVACLVFAHKYTSDYCTPNHIIAYAAGIKTSDLMELEMHFFRRMFVHLFVKKHDFWHNFAQMYFFQ